MILVLLGALFLLFANLYSLPLCGSQCAGAFAGRTLIYIVLMLVAVGGFVWTLVRNGPRADIWGLIWFIAGLAFGLVLPTADQAITLR